MMYVLAATGVGLITVVVLYALSLRRNNALINKLAEIAAKYVHIKKFADEQSALLTSKNATIKAMLKELNNLSDAATVVARYNRMFGGTDLDNRATVSNERTPGKPGSPGERL